MNKKKIIMILILVFVLILGGAGILYKQLGQKLAPDLLATQAPQKTESTEASLPTTQEGESEKILAPDFTVYDLDGNEVHLSDFIGKSVVLNFWASWCSPCKMEMPDFNEKYLEIGEEVQFLIINMTDGSRETVETILSRYFTIQIRMPLQSTVFIHCLPHILLTLRETQSPRQLVQSTKELCSEEST